MSLENEVLGTDQIAEDMPCCWPSKMVDYTKSLSSQAGTGAQLVPDVLSPAEKDNIVGCFPSDVNRDATQSTDQGSVPNSLLPPFIYQPPKEHNDPQVTNRGNEAFLKQQSDIISPSTSEDELELDCGPLTPHRKLSYEHPCLTFIKGRRSSTIRSEALRSEANQREIITQTSKCMDVKVKAYANKPHHSEPSRGKPRLYFDSIEEDGGQIEEAVCMIFCNIVPHVLTWTIACRDDDPEPVQTSYDFNLSAACSDESHEFISPKDSLFVTAIYRAAQILQYSNNHSPAITSRYWSG